MLLREQYTYYSNDSGLAQAFLSTCVLNKIVSGIIYQGYELCPNHHPLTICELFLINNVVSSGQVSTNPSLVIFLQLYHTRERQLDEAHDTAATEISKERPTHLLRLE